MPNPHTVYPLLTWRYALALITLTFFLHEAHELVHIFAGWSVCGAFGPRDFNVWSLAEGCRVIWPTLIGPAFSFALMWLGAYWLYVETEWKRYLGFALVFTPLPFARILTAAGGGGDEVWALRRILKDQVANSGTVAEWTGLALVLLLSIPPLIVAYRAIGRRRRWAWFLGFLLIPVAIDLAVVLGALNSILAAGVLAEPWIWGTPRIITIYTVILLVVLAFFGRHLVTDKLTAEQISKMT
ncbi:MAG: hypothetical protein AAGI08_07515 [Bacteroidota bacterium]